MRRGGKLPVTCCYPRYQSSFLLIPDSPLERLRRAAQGRRRQAYRPSTLRNHHSTHMLYIQFSLVFGMATDAPMVDDLGAFAEWLLASGLAPATVRNHLSAVRMLYIWWNKPQVLDVFSSNTWALTLRGILNSSLPRLSSKTAISIQHLFVMSQVCIRSIELAPFLVGLLFSFFGYLRISNVAPYKVTEWDSARHMSWADVTTTGEGVVVSLKWTKTRQHAPHPAVIPLPELGDSILCPLRAWHYYESLLEKIVTMRDKMPLLLNTSQPVGLPVTVPQFRATFHRVAAVSDGAAQLSPTRRESLSHISSAMEHGLRMR